MIFIIWNLYIFDVIDCICSQRPPRPWIAISGAISHHLWTTCTTLLFKYYSYTRPKCRLHHQGILRTTVFKFFCPLHGYSFKKSAEDISFTRCNFYRSPPFFKNKHGKFMVIFRYDIFTYLASWYLNRFSQFKNELLNIHTSSKIIINKYSALKWIISYNNEQRYISLKKIFIFMAKVKL